MRPPLSVDAHACYRPMTFSPQRMLI